MPTETEMTAAYDLLPFVRARIILAETEHDFEDEEISSWLRWAYKKDPAYDWTFFLMQNRVEPFISEFASYIDARNSFFSFMESEGALGMEEDDIDTVCSIIIKWLEQKESDMKGIPIWNGVTYGDYYVGWSLEEGGFISQIPADLHSQPTIMMHL